MKHQITHIVLLTTLSLFLIALLLTQVSIKQLYAQWWSAPVTFNVVTELPEPEPEPEPEPWTGWGWWWWWGGGGSIFVPRPPITDEQHDAAPMPPDHGAAPFVPELKTRECTYTDENYKDNGPFRDTINHRWFNYIEIMRLSCMHRWRWTSVWARVYDPDANITRAEIIKTIVKLLWIYYSDFVIESENKAYQGPIVFADVPATHWFAHYASYAYNKWLLDTMRYTKNNQKYIDPDTAMTRYEAIRIMMIAYQKIDTRIIAITTRSLMGDVIDKNNPYYSYIRNAETLWFISWVPKIDGSYSFEGQRNITRAEFAKIIAIPFGWQLFDVPYMIENSSLYMTIRKAIDQTSADKKLFIDRLFDDLQSIDREKFLQRYKIDRMIYLKHMYDMLADIYLLNNKYE